MKRTVFCKQFISFEDNSSQTLVLASEARNQNTVGEESTEDKDPDDGGARTDSGSDFKLSDKVCRGWVEVVEVKEFIRRLKEEFHITGIPEEDFEEFYSFEIRDIIDKLSGAELTNE